MKGWNRPGGRRWIGTLALALLLTALLAACGDDEKDTSTTTPAQTAAAPVLGSAPSLPAAPGLNVGAPGGEAGTEGEERKLPGCADPNAEECPSPLPPALDATASAQGVQVDYYSRYWEAITSDSAGDPAIVIRPSEANKFALKGVFTVRFASSAEAVLADLPEAEQSIWTAANLGKGTVATVVDDSAAPPRATVYGVFPLEDGRALVFEMDATGQYSLDFHHDVYAAMLDSLKLDAE